ncbi:odorant receptor 49b-like [Bacillus rossius redtenbacheri]|uniref:odorant receptor 49b-like n=1 Tax=Bacillus rossius redtenbacheri TaxID=93214 RepID=UPI002FDC7F73
MFAVGCFGVEKGARLENIGNLLTFAPYCVAGYSMTRRSSAYRDLLAALQTAERHSPALRRAVRAEAVIARYRDVRCYTGLAGFAITCYMLAPFLTLALDTSSGLQLPLRVPRALETGDPLVFAAQFAAQLLLVGLVSVSSLPMDVLGYALLVHTAGRFESLCQLVREADRLLGLPAGSAAPRQAGDQPQAEEQSHGALDHLITLHQQYLSNAKKLSELLSPVFLAHYLLASLTLCLVMYQFMMAEDNTQMIKNCFHALGTMFRLLSFSYLSSLLSHSTESVGDAAYDCKWYDYCRSDCNTIHVMICRAQRPVLMRASHFAVMSLATFASLLRSSYSYFNILDKIYTS